MLKSGDRRWYFVFVMAWAALVLAALIKVGVALVRKIGGYYGG